LSVAKLLQDDNTLMFVLTTDCGDGCAECTIDTTTDGNTPTCIQCKEGWYGPTNDGVCHS